jgi:hypothetical protein
LPNYQALIKTFFCLALSLMAFSIKAKDQLQELLIAEAFIELHTGPGRGYPVFHIEEKNKIIKLIKKKTQWYKIKTEKDIEGWVHEKTLELTLDTSLEKTQNFVTVNKQQKDFNLKKIEAGFLAGDFGGATSLTLYSGWNFTPNLSVEVALSQALGNVADIRHIDFSLVHQPFPEWRVTPFFKLGAGVIQTSPFATLVQTEDRTDEMIHVGMGVKAYISRQFFIRLEYVDYTILTSRNDNDEVEEWKLGFSVFY